MEEYHIYDENNNEFIVTNNFGNFNCKKVVGAQLVDPTKEELEFVIQELQKIANKTKTVNLDDMLNTIRSMIENNEINNYEELQKYINNLNISEQDKYTLFEKSCEYLNVNKKENSEIIKLKDELIHIIRNNKSKDIKKVISFDVRSNIGDVPLCNINLKTIDNNISKEHKNITHYYTDELKRDLIEPVLQEMVLTSQATQSVEPSDSSFGYRSNLHIKTEENCFVSLNNIEQDYAYKLQDEILSLNNSPKISDPTARDSKINELQNEKKNEMQLEQENQLKLVKNKKMDNNGFSSNLIIYLLITIVTTFIILTQIILFK